MGTATDLIRPIIFISYSHDSDEHREAVLGLSERLRADGFETCLDQYVNGTPAETWPRWMLDRLDESSHVLVICTETYYRRFRGHEVPGKGNGVDWEGALITQTIYDARSTGPKFIPILLTTGHPDHIPEPLRGRTHYSVSFETNYSALCDFLLSVAGVEPGEIGDLKERTRRTGNPITFGNVACQQSSKPSNLPYLSLGSLFKGRDEFLDNMRNKLQGARHVSAIVGAQAMHGLGGLGKTRAAVEYALRHVDDYSALLFVAADRPEALEKNLAELCGQLVLNLPEQDLKDQPVRVNAVVAWLQKNSGWLLILDNVDDEKAANAVEGLLPQLRAGHVLITSRFDEWSGAVERLDLEVLSLDASIEFLQLRTLGRHRIEPDEAKAVAELARELDGLPLALEQAAAFIIAKQESFAGYLARWKAHEQKVRTWHDPVRMNYPRSITVTWDTSFGQLDSSSQALLNMLCWFAPDQIPVELWQTKVSEKTIACGAQRLSLIAKSLRESDTTVNNESAVLSSGDTPNLDPGAAEQQDAEEARAGLSRYGLIQWRANGSAFSVHRLVQDVTRERLAAGKATAWLQHGLWVLSDYLPAHPSPQDVRSWPRWDAVRVHVANILQLADEQGIADPTMLRLMNDLGMLLTSKCLWHEAEPLLRRASAIDERSFGTAHPKVATRFNNLSLLLQATGRFREAEPLMRSALAVDEQSFGADHPSVAIRLNNLAQLLQATNRQQEAEPLMHRALAIDVRHYGAEHTHVAIRLNNLAVLLLSTGRTADAEPLMLQALAIDEHSYGNEHPNVARDLNNLVQLLRNTNRLAEAEPLMRRAVAIDEQSYGPGHPNVAVKLNNLALLLQSMNCLAEAERLMRRAIDIDARSYGSGHPDVAIKLNNLAKLLQDTDRHSEAEPLWRHAVEILQRSLGDDDPKTIKARRKHERLLDHLSAESANKERRNGG